MKTSHTKMARERLVLSVVCPTCEAEIGHACNRMGARFARTYYRGSGASIRNSQRKVPHDARVRAAERKAKADFDKPSKKDE